MKVTPVSRERLVEEVAGLVAERPGRVRLAIDGPPPTEPDELADSVSEQLRALGRAAVPVRAADFLRPASVRLEYGREDPDELLTSWLDVAGLTREVLGTSGPVLPRLWDAAVDRAYRADYVQLPDDGVVVLSGSLLLGRGLPIDMSVHLQMSAAALARRLPLTDHWTLPAYARYAAAGFPADLVVLSDHPSRPAIQRG